MQSVADPAAELLNDVRSAVESIDDYQVRVASWVISDDGTEERRIINFYFKRPDSLRVDVIEGSRFGDTGSVAILSDGKVTVKPGLRLFPFPVTYDKDHPRVTSIRGRTIDKAHVGVILDDMRVGLAQGVARVFDAGDYRVYEATHREESAKLVERVFISNETMLPVHYESTSDGELVEYVDWLHYLLNQGLPGEAFDVGFSAKQMARLPVLTLAAWEIGEAERLAVAPGPRWSAAE